MRLELTIGNKNYSSWSLRAWLLMRVCELPFTETLIPLDQADTAERIRAVNPAGTVPVLTIEHADGRRETVGDTLAITETLAERFPDAGVWPDDPLLRAQARSVAAEMHSSFMALRNQMPMNIRRRKWNRGPMAPTADTARNIARIETLWATCRALPGRGDGPFLFGRFTAADAMYAPVATRLAVYEVPVRAESLAYIEAIYTLPAMQDWIAAAHAEPWTIEHEDV